MARPDFPRIDRRRLLSAPEHERHGDWVDRRLHCSFRTSRNTPVDTRAVQDYLRHESIADNVRYFRPKGSRHSGGRI